MCISSRLQGLVALTLIFLILNVQGYAEVDRARCFSARNIESCSRTLDMEDVISSDELSTLISLIRDTPSAKGDTSYFLLNAVDKILRKAYFDQAFYRSLVAMRPNLPKILQDGLVMVNPKNSYFYTLGDKALQANGSNAPFQNWMTAKILSHAPKRFKADKPLRVFHVAMESYNIKFGGVGTYLMDLTRAEMKFQLNRKNAIKPAYITPFYDVLKRDVYDNVKFVGFVPHIMDGKVYYASVYELKDPKNMDATQFLIQADPNFKNPDSADLRHSQGAIFDIGQIKDLYNHFDDEMFLYFSSAAASFGALFRGSTGDENADILQINDWHLAFIPAILKTALNQARQDAFLPKVITIATTHELNAAQGQNGSYLYKRIGLPQPKSDHINMQASFNLDSDVSLTVSKEIAREMRTPETAFGLEHIFQYRYNTGKFKGITNGFNFKSFDSTKKENLFQFTVDSNLRNLLAKKQEVKRYLAGKGIIGSADLPLVLYVGRLSPEKGLDVFEAFLDEIKTLNIQAVIMGVPVNDEIRAIMRGLQEKYKDYPNIKIYLDIKAQTDGIDGAGSAQKGKLIRFAADFTLIPSIEEACGIVPMEAMALGSIPFTSHVHGLKDIVKSDIDAKISGNIFSQPTYTFTGCSFYRGAKEATMLDMRKRLYEVITMWRQAPGADHQRFMSYIVQQANLMDWGSLDPAEKRGVNAYYELYKNAMISPYEGEEATAEFSQKHFPDPEPFRPAENVQVPNIPGISVRTKKNLLEDLEASLSGTKGFLDARDIDRYPAIRSNIRLLLTLYKERVQIFETFRLKGKKAGQAIAQRIMQKEFGIMETINFFYDYQSPVDTDVLSPADLKNLHDYLEQIFSTINLSFQLAKKLPGQIKKCYGGEDAQGEFVYKSCSPMEHFFYNAFSADFECIPAKINRIRSWKGTMESLRA